MADRTARLVPGTKRALVALAIALISLLAFAPGAGAQAPGDITVDGEACTDGEGVTVIVDLQELGDDTIFVRCAPDAPADGFAAFTQAGIPYREALNSPGFLCRIFDRPDTDPCDATSPADAYWSYWLAPAGGEWCYSNYGAGNRTPPPGAVEGWSFALDKVAEEVPPPRLDPPAAPAGTEPTPLAEDDCTTPSSSDGADPSAGTEAGSAGAPVGRGEAVDPDAAGESGSPIGLIVAIAAIALLAAIAAVVVIRRRQSEESEAPLTDAERAALRSPASTPPPAVRQGADTPPRAADGPLPVVDRAGDLDDPSVAMWAPPADDAE